MQPSSSVISGQRPGVADPDNQPSQPRRRLAPTDSTSRFGSSAVTPSSLREAPMHQAPTLPDITPTDASSLSLNDRVQIFHSLSIVDMKRHMQILLHGGSEQESLVSELVRSLPQKKFNDLMRLYDPINEPRAVRNLLLCVREDFLPGFFFQDLSSADQKIYLQALGAFSGERNRYSELFCGLVQSLDEYRVCDLLRECHVITERRAIRALVGMVTPELLSQVWRLISLTLRTLSSENMQTLAPLPVKEKAHVVKDDDGSINCPISLCPIDEDKRVYIKCLIKDGQAVYQAFDIDSLSEYIARAYSSKQTPTNPLTREVLYISNIYRD